MSEAVTAAATLPQTPPRRRWLRVPRPSAGWVGLVLLAIIALPCFVTLPWSLQQYDAQNVVDAQAIYAPPGAAQWFGTDDLGRSLLWRCLLGGAISLTIGICAALLALCIGVTWGAMAGYFGGRIDSAMMRIVDVIYGLPYILMVVLVGLSIDGVVQIILRRSAELEAVAVEAGEDFTPWFFVRFLESNGELVNIFTLVVAIGVVSWLTMARVIRGQVLSLRAQPFIEATQAMGMRTPRVFVRHLLPNLVGPVVVYATLAVPQAILQESFLSFLGIGVRAPLPSWGNLAAEGVTEMPALAVPELQMYWWLLVFPCGLLGMTLLGLNFVGDALRDRFDPKRSTRGS